MEDRIKKAKEYAEQDYGSTPISVLRYIGVLEELLVEKPVKQKRHVVVKHPTAQPPVQVFYAITTEYTDDEIKDSNMLAVKGWTIIEEFPTKEQAIKNAKYRNDYNRGTKRKFQFPWQK